MTKNIKCGECIFVLHWQEYKCPFMPIIMDDGTDWKAVNPDEVHDNCPARERECD